MKPICLLLAILATTTSLTAWAAATPKVGDKAPQIEAKDQDGNTWRLADQLGKSIVLLYFYPKDDTPGCTTEACGFRDQINDFQKAGVAVVGISRDDATSHQKFRTKYNLNFPLLVDTDGKVTGAFGASVPGKAMARRVSFLIGKDGSILHVTDDRRPEVHLAEMNEAIAKATAPAATGAEPPATTLSPDKAGETTAAAK